MTPQHKLQHLILVKAAEFDDSLTVPPMDADAISAAYQDLIDNEQLWDAESETREGQVETDIPCQSSRHYESKSVAAQCRDGSWVGWTYWYGGGKYGEPEAIEWICDAYDLTVTEEEKVVTVRTFKKVPA